MFSLVIGSALTFVLAALVRCVRRDGLGDRPPPPVRPHEEGDAPW